MADNPSDESFDNLLRDHFARELDPQHGRSLAALDQLSRSNATAQAKQPANRRWRSFVALTVVMAASVAVMIVLRQASRPGAAPGPRPDLATQQDPFEPALPPSHAIVDSPAEPRAIPGDDATAGEAPQSGVASSLPVRPSADQKHEQNSKSLARQRAKRRAHDRERIEVDSGTSLDDVDRRPLNASDSPVQKVP